MKYLSSLLILVNLTCYGQLDLLMHENFDYNLWKLDYKVDKKKDIITSAKLSILEILTYMEISLEREIDNFYFGYFNKDSLIDIIYYGSIGSEGQYSIIYLNMKNDYKAICQIGKITHLNYHENCDLPEIQDIKSPCCDDYVNTVSRYVPNNNGKYDKVQTLYFDDGIQFPQKINMNINFKVVKAQYHLRKTPLIDNEIKGKHDPIGNISNTYSSGDEGVAFAKLEDDTGRIWWYVLMKNPTPNDKKFPLQDTYYLGWMSSKYIELIEK